jgi:WW domain-binding protein 4
MTEFWKSNKKIYCELCKSWYADNRAQREHHETGMKHKNAILSKIRQVGIQSRQRDDADKHMRATLIAMEVAAHGAYRNDQRQQHVSTSYNVHRPTTGYSVPQSVTTPIGKSTGLF